MVAQLYRIVINVKGEMLQCKEGWEFQDAASEQAHPRSQLLSTITKLRVTFAAPPQLWLVA